jgi:predicted metalloprotease
MKLGGLRESGNIEDRRGLSSRGVAGGGIGVVILALVVMALGGDPRQILGGMGSSQPSKSGAYQSTPEEDKRKELVSKVLADTEDVWTKLFRERGAKYEVPKLVLFTESVDSACGTASKAVGPFYCGEDQKVYIDLGFYDELSNRFGAKGDFAQAYVIAHEVGHHVQKLLGALDKVHAQKRSSGKGEANEASVRLELQADFYAGVWAHHAQRMKDILDKNDIEEGLAAASAIGDDKLQMQSQGYVAPDSFTHGSSAQRVRWFRKGWESGDIRQGDTFSARSL